MRGIEVRVSKDLEYCADCRKQGTGYTTVHVGIFKMPFCRECYEKFKAKIMQGAGRRTSPYECH